ncbi:MAG: ABC transporter substrate-binding protein [Chlamydiales bacterium]
MHEDPFLFRFVRVVSLFILVCLFGFIYWSLLLIEEDLKEVRIDIKNLQRERMIPSRELRQKDRDYFGPLADDRYLNLLEEDPFYETTLPQLLGPSFAFCCTRRSAILGKPHHLHPFSGWRQANDWIDLCTATLAVPKFGFYEVLSPSFAWKMEERPRPDGKGSEYWIHLRRDLYWEPLSEKMFEGDVTLSEHFKQRHRVNAWDVVFYFDAMMNPHFHEAGAVALRNYFGDIEDIEVIDDDTLVVRWRSESFRENDGEVNYKVPYSSKIITASMRPLPRFVYQYFANGEKIIDDEGDPRAYRRNAVWAQNFTEHWSRHAIVSCGPWVFEGMTDRDVYFSRNSHFFTPLRALTSFQNIIIREHPDSIWQAFKLGELDTYTLQPQQIVEWEDFSRSPQYAQQVAEGNSVERLDYLDRSYTYIGWNQNTPFFKNKNVRLAMTLAIDRQRIIRDILNGMGVEITGPFAFASTSYDKNIEPWPYDPSLAKQLLEAEGWFDQNLDGIRDKEIDGNITPFQFTLTYYVKSLTMKTICTYIATALKDIGVDCQLRGVDLNDLSATFDNKDFDAICLAWSLGSPPEDPKQLWHSSGATLKGSSNAIGFANKEADRVIEQLRFEDNRNKRQELYHRFHAILHEQQPYTFLFTPKNILLYRSYLKNVFIPAERQDLVPGAKVDQPVSEIFWIDEKAREKDRI